MSTLTGYKLHFAVIELPNGKLVRIDNPNHATGVCRDGSTWDGTLGFGVEAQAAVDEAIDDFADLFPCLECEAAIEDGYRACDNCEDGMREDA